MAKLTLYIISIKLNTVNIYYKVLFHVSLMGFNAKAIEA
ncbi:hypothetical protein LEP1GSC034_4245 [Leptospira interrogans str. 2003000735]|uniref:Uncharacterized protein n=6 Tax=Leptospira interrogans TaxID=173 RepID=A0A0F6HFA4_LEPIR|nr:Uncharacterized protein A9P81_0607 [Leptospira interrogans serovar Copenhageni/Icterohaemorrhagiae]EKN85971.1 hypothetical protein LEP1GSC027_0188 [Leptospira interrogans str. 2002000624]EKO23302.1 hypothetical protein LEP1GSC104_0178 [Leptospira interrogans str. UI 12621]EKO87313.1 hypothetical protein LEP1GSC009_3514 [Leptospira interrogans serovar Grippotyphosa str. Andaman]EKP24515.1 hypothetical protein LEP1GSC117_1533 [Leptospira interrogans serovar Icterohaemorrhagiae str. Verdun LP]